jgi:photosystem II stability/assembly factor-like uncharacterized protein
MSTPALTLNAFDFIDHETGFALNSDTLVATADAGRTWERRGHIDSLDRLQALQFFDRVHGAAASEGCNPDCRVALLQTHDGGRNWWEAALLPTNGGFEFKTLHASSNGAGVAAAYRGLAITTDFGQTWKSLDVPSEPGHVLNAAAMLDETHLWVDSYPEARGPSILWFSSNGGETWQERYRGLPLGDIEFFDAQHGWARVVESYYSTDDGGHSWHEIDMPKVNRIFEAVFVDPLNGWFSAPSGEEGPSTYRIFRTENGGETWREQAFEAPDNDVATNLDFVDAQTGWFTTTPSCAFGVGCGLSAHRTVLYHTTGGGGLSGQPDIELPIVGAGQAGPTSTMPALLLTAAGALAIAAALALRRRNLGR